MNPIRAAALCLIVGVPVTLSAAVARQQRGGSAALTELGATGLLLSVLSLWAYGISALQLSMPAPVPEPARVIPLAKGHKPPRSAGPGPLRLWLITVLFSAGALCVGLLAPLLTGALQPSTALPTEEHRVWSLLAAVVGGGLSVTITAVFLGNALSPARSRGLRPISITPMLIMAGLGAITYVVISFHSPQTP